MTKKHFICMAQYVATARRAASDKSLDHLRLPLDVQADAVYSFAIYLANTFGANFDRARFDEYIEKHSKV